MSNRRRRQRRRRKPSIALEGARAATKSITLAQPMGLAVGGLETDREKGTLKNVSILAKGEAIGHGFIVDDTMLHQVAAVMNGRAGGVKSRMTHPSGGFFGGKDGIESMVGMAGVGTVRVEGDRVRGDIQLMPFAKSNPTGNLWEFLMDLAEHAPSEIGLSIVFEPGDFQEREENGETLLPAGRVEDVLAVDFVGDPGANPTGLLGARPNNRKTNSPDGTGVNGTGDGTMNEQLKRYLMTIGLKADASDDEAVAFWNTREGLEKTYADSLAAAPAGKKKPGKGDDGKATPPGKLTKKEDDPPQSLTEADVKKLTTKVIADHQSANNHRLVGLKAIAVLTGLGVEWATEQFTADKTLEEAQTLALKHVAENWQPPAAAANMRASVGVNRATEGLGDAISDALLLRAGVKLITIDPSTNLAERTESGKLLTRKPHERSERFRRLSLIDTGRAWLEALGVSEARDMGKLEIAALMTSRRALMNRNVNLAQSSSDFPLILADTMGKSLRMAYEEAPSTWQAWASRTTTPDFKDMKPTSLSESPNLVLRLEGGEIKYVTLGESREVYALAEYTSGIILTRKSLVNDEMGAFRRIPQLQGSAARRKEDDVTYAILTANAALSDTGALFNSTAVTSTGGHANDAGSGGAPTITTLNAGDTAMGLQKGIKLAAQLNLVPKIIMAPRALKGTVLRLLNSTADPTASGNAGVANIWQGQLQPVFEARLDANSSTAWYLAADPGQIDTVQVAFLEGEETPVLKSETEFDTDDVKLAVRHTVAAKALDFRGLYRNSGA